MDTRKIAFILAVVAMIISPLTSLAVDPKYAQSQEKADEYYDEKEYKKAYKKYLYLAKVGDSFAQYRVSYMKNYGQGTREDRIAAFGWAALSAQNGAENLVSYRDALWQELSAEDKEEALEEGEKLLARYGNLALAEKARKAGQRRLRTCTGSRLSTRCESVVVTSLGIGMGMEVPGNSGGEPTGVDRTNMASEAAARGTTEPQFVEIMGLRESMNQIDQYIAEESGGTVTLGELEVLEGQVQAEDQANDSAKQ
jgi:hypothetical protein